MASTSIGEALQQFFKSARWESKMNELRLQSHWEEIMGKTIAKYTRNVYLKENVLYITTDVAPLKHELQVGKEQLIHNINTFFHFELVKSVVIR
jgi:predicted nucleic acid-binding Zn ribbon protein